MIETTKTIDENEQVTKVAVTPADLAAKAQPDTDKAGDDQAPAAEIEDAPTEDQPDTDKAGDQVEDADKADMFPRKYVEKLRKENADYRGRAEAAHTQLDAAQRQLFTALVQLDGRVADPADVPFDAALLSDTDALSDAIDDLVTRKPGLRARAFSGNAGQGPRGSKTPAKVNLIDLIRG